MDPAYPDRHPVNLGGLGGIQQETAELRRELLATKFSPTRKPAISFISSAFERY